MSTEGGLETSTKAIQLWEKKNKNKINKQVLFLFLCDLPILFSLAILFCVLCNILFNPLFLSLFQNVILNVQDPTVIYIYIFVTAIGLTPDGSSTVHIYT
jgi:hypothetical protein